MKKQKKWVVNLNDNAPVAIPDDTKITVVLGLGNGEEHSIDVNACDRISLLKTWIIEDDIGPERESDIVLTLNGQTLANENR